MNAPTLHRHIFSPRAYKILQVLVGLWISIAASALGWQSDLGNGFYKNPVLFSDYSDPDVIRVDSKFYLVSSSFHYMPGIPVLASEDLVNWKIIGHVFDRFEFDPAYNLTNGDRYGAGCWAPAIRYHDGRFWVYFPTPQEGIFMSTAKSAAGPWSPVVQVKAVAGWEDPCPFWDDDGKAYLVHSVLGAGPLILHRLSPDGTKLLDDGVVIVQDKNSLPVLEGPKMYKLRGYYYIFAPAGGVEHGWQEVLRSTNIYGPYEYKKVLAQGNTAINGPHQGAYVETRKGQPWFVHFQSRGPYGRVFWLEPVDWKNDWPVIGQPSDENGVGEPVLKWRKMLTHSRLDPMLAGPIQIPAESDGFDSKTLGLQWQWNHNPVDSKWSLVARPGYLRLEAMSADSLLHARNTLTQMLSDPVQNFTTSMEVAGMADGQVAGLCLFQNPPAWIGVIQTRGQKKLALSMDGQMTYGPSIDGNLVRLQAGVINGVGNFAYSTDGKAFVSLGSNVNLRFSWWKGARVGLFSYNTTTETSHPMGFADFDWFHVTDGSLN